MSNPERKTNRARVIKAWNEIAGVLISQIDWRKAKKEKNQCIYEEYGKPKFPREIQASKLDESSAIKLP